MVRRRLIVRGRVQGVFFRDSTRRLAVEHRVAGWISNRADGSVEAVLEGPADGVEAVIAFCRVGPEGAAVDSVAMEAEEPTGEQGFRVR